MSDDTKLSISFDGVDCDVIGYDEPFTVLMQAVGVVNNRPDAATSGPVGDLPDSARAELAAIVAADIGDAVVEITKGEGRVIVTHKSLATETPTAPEPAPAAAEEPAAKPVEASAPAVETVEPAKPRPVEVEVEETAVEESAPPAPAEPAPVAAEEPAAEPPLDEAPADEVAEAPEPAEVEEAAAEETAAPSPAEAPTPEPEPEPVARIETPAPKPEEPAARPTRVKLQRVQQKTTQKVTLSRDGGAPSNLTPIDAARAALEGRSPAARAQTPPSDNFLFSDIESEDEPAPEEKPTSAEAAAPSQAREAPRNVEAAPRPAEEPRAATARQAENDRERSSGGALKKIFGAFGGRSKKAADEPPAQASAPASEPTRAPEPVAERKAAPPPSAPAAEAAPTEGDVGSTSGHRGFDRLREVAEANLIELEEPTLNLRDAEPGERRLVALSSEENFPEDSSPAAFARKIGAKTLQDLMEASAVYMSIVEGRAEFSRKDLMRALDNVPLDKEYSPEARLKSFRRLLTNGALVRVDDGRFSISHATRFGYESQLRA